MIVLDSYDLILSLIQSNFYFNSRSNSKPEFLTQFFMRKVIFKLVFYPLLLTTIFAILGYFGRGNWILDLLSHFKFQYLIILTLGSGILFLLKKRVALVFIPFIILLGIEVVPIYFGGNKNMDLTNPTKIVCINLLSSNNNFSKVEQYISEKSPDIVVLLELTNLWQNMLRPVLDDYEYHFTVSRLDNFGIAVYSKVQLTDLRDLKVGNAQLPSIAGEFYIDSLPVTFIATHPLPPISYEEFESRNSQLSELAKISSEIDHEVILIGDLNTSSFSAHFKDLVKRSNLIDSRKGFGLKTSWPVGAELFHITLDHCLISDGLFIKTRETGSDVGSDHLPIYVEIGVE